MVANCSIAASKSAVMSAAMISGAGRLADSSSASSFSQNRLRLHRVRGPVPIKSPNFRHHVVQFLAEFRVTGLEWFGQTDSLLVKFSDLGVDVSECRLSVFVSVASLAF